MSRSASTRSVTSNASTTRAARPSKTWSVAVISTSSSEPSLRRWLQMPELLRPLRRPDLRLPTVERSRRHLGWGDEVFDRHADELIARIAIEGERCVVDGDEDAALEVVDVHRTGVVLEEEPIRRFGGSCGGLGPAAFGELCRAPKPRGRSRPPPALASRSAPRSAPAPARRRWVASRKVALSRRIGEATLR